MGEAARRRDWSGAHSLALDLARPNLTLRFSSGRCGCFVPALALSLSFSPVQEGRAATTATPARPHRAGVLHDSRATGLARPATRAGPPPPAAWLFVKRDAAAPSSSAPIAWRDPAAPPGPPPLLRGLKRAALVAASFLLDALEDRQPAKKALDEFAMADTPSPAELADIGAACARVLDLDDNAARTGEYTLDLQVR